MKPTPGSPNHSMPPSRCSARTLQFCSVFTSAQVEAVTRAFFGSNSSAILEQYQESPPFARFGTLLTDSLVTCYVRHVARLISSANTASVRLYTNMHAPSLQADPTNWKHFECAHGSLCQAGDNGFTFASYDLVSSQLLFTLTQFQVQRYRRRFVYSVRAVAV